MTKFILKISHTFLLTSLFALLVCLTTSVVKADTVSFPIGIGGSDVITRQVVRTNTDKLYVFSYSGDQSATLNVHWTPVAGLPAATADFSGFLSVTDSSNILSVDTAYDGGNFIHVITNSQDGIVRDRPFDLTTNTFKPTKVISTGNPVVTGVYVGTSGVSSLFDQSGNLNLATWTAGNHITFARYSYDSATDTLALVEAATQIDGVESTNNNHPSLAISPLNGDVILAWVSGSNGAGNIWVRTKSAGVWGVATKVNSAPAWTSPNDGLNIDQGPSMAVNSAGKIYMVYIENWRATAPYDYGKLHVVTNTGSGWVDREISSYSHDPAIAINSIGEAYVIGHGSPLDSTCTSMGTICTRKENADGSFGLPLPLVTESATQSFDSSPSVKWSVVGFNRPETIEYVVPNVLNGYMNSSLVYGRIDSGVVPTPSPTPSPIPSPIPSPVPTPSPIPSPVPTPSPSPSPVPTPSPSPSPVPTPSPSPSPVPTPSPSPSPVPTPSPSPSPVPSPTPTPTPTPTPSTLILQINAGANDVTQDNTTYDTTGSTLWVGNGSSATASYLGLRFTNVSIPKNATITSAKVEFYASSTQWQSIKTSIAADKVASSASWSTTSKPSQRTLTTAKIAHSSNTPWTINTWYQFDEMKSVVQEIVNQSTWTTGNNLSIIMKGSGTAWGRKFMKSYEGGATTAPRLVITYQ